MRDNIEELIPPEERCESCKKRKATRLCDYINGTTYMSVQMGGLNYGKYK